MYQSKLNLIETQKAIKVIKNIFEDKIAKRLNLTRVSAPMFVEKNSALNDDLNGIEEPVSFKILDKNIEIVHSLAKWKRKALYDYRFDKYQGLYTDMNAIRKDETLNNTHSLYVDQWDWEKIISKEDRNIEYLKKVVKDIYKCLVETEKEVNKLYNKLENKLPEDIYFITSEDLLKMYPNLTSKERENAITRTKGAVFLIGIGNELSDGKPHDGRSPDYDDWKLNGDILLYNPVLDEAFEISSMGIRVDSKSLVEQLTKRNKKEKLKHYYHKMILDDVFPLTIGGGIGQSRLSMFLLEKKHIGEVQSSYWPDEIRKNCEKENIILL